MVLWKKKKSSLQNTSMLEKYVVHKIDPGIRDGTEKGDLLKLAYKCFQNPTRQFYLKDLLFNYGQSLAITSAIGLAKGLEGLSKSAIKNIEIADCYLTTIFCFSLCFKNSPDLLTDALSHWGEKFDNQIEHLVLENSNTSEDLLENGWEIHANYSRNEEAKLPQAYLLTLSKALHLRTQDFETPYKDMNLSIGSNMLLYHDIEKKYDDIILPAVNELISTILEVQEIADEYEQEFWQDY